MPDPASQEVDLSSQIIDAPQAMWAKIKQLLKVETREQAAAMAEADPTARRAIVDILTGAEETTLTAPRARAESFLTSPAKSKPPLAEQMYGKSRPKVTF